MPQNLSQLTNPTLTLDPKKMNRRILIAVLCSILGALPLSIDLYSQCANNAALGLDFDEECICIDWITESLPPEYTGPLTGWVELSDNGGSGTAVTNQQDYCLMLPDLKFAYFDHNDPAFGWQEHDGLGPCDPVKNGLIVNVSYAPSETCSKSCLDTDPGNLAIRALLNISPQINILSYQMNLGNGPIEFEAFHPAGSEDLHAVRQNIYAIEEENGDRVFRKLQIPNEGTFYPDDGHSHFHIDDFWKATLLKEVNGEFIEIETIDKEGWCLRETSSLVVGWLHDKFTANVSEEGQSLVMETIFPGIADPSNSSSYSNYGLGGNTAPNSGYSSGEGGPCELGTGLLGIRSGYWDLYSNDYDGQYFFTGNLCDGNYRLDVEINPERKFLESDYSNNKFSHFFSLENHLNASEVIIESGDEIHWECLPYQVIASDIVIRNSSTLRITDSDLAFTSGKGIYVEEGSALIIEGSHLDAAKRYTYNQDCIDGTWKGIQMKSDGNFSFGGPGSGPTFAYLSINNSTLSHAEAAVWVGDGSDYLNPEQGAGLGSFDISDSHFLNNRRSIVFSGPISEGGGLISFPGNVFTISLQGNEFSNDLSYGAANEPIHLHFANVPEQQGSFIGANAFECPGNGKNGIGIRVINSSVVIGDISSEDMYTTSEFANEFTGLFKGIEAIGHLGLQAGLSSYGNVFTRTRYGITLIGIDASQIYDNRFFFTEIDAFTSLPQGVNEQQYGVYAYGCQGVAVNGNGFINIVENPDWVYGVVFRGGSGADSEIIDNYLHGQFRSGLQFEQGNENLRINCNLYQNYNHRDWFLSSGSLNSQGICESSAPTLSLTEHWHLSEVNEIGDRNIVVGNDAEQLVISVANEGFEPTKVTGGVQIENCDVLNDSETNPCNWRQQALDLQESAQNWITWNSSIDGNQTRNLIKYHRRKGTLDELRTTLEATDSDHCRQVLIATYISEGRDSLAEALLGELDLEIVHNQRFYETYSILNSYAILEDAGSGKHSLLQARHKEINEGIYKAVIERQLIQQSGSYPVRSPEEVAAHITRPIASAPSIEVFPNPATDVLNIELNGSASGTLRMISPIGIIVKTIPLTAEDVQSLTISLDGVSTGMYLVNVQSSAGSSTKRIFIHSTQR